MKALETTVIINERRKLTLARALETTEFQREHISVLISEDNQEDADDTLIERIIEGIHEGFREALTGQTISLSKMWEGVASAGSNGENQG